MIQYNDNWKVIDSTKIQTAQNCLRWYFYQFILGWRPKASQIDLEFGTAWHLAMEHLLLHGFSDKAVQEAFSLFDEHYRQHYSVVPNARAKTPGNALRGLVQYCKLYEADAFEVLHTEVAGSVLIDTTRQLFFRIDAVIEDPGYGRAILEHKTSGTLGRYWTDQWNQKIQIGTYIFVLECLYPGIRKGGVIINGFFPHDPPKLKLDGEPYAGAKDNEFMRIPINKTTAMLNDWLYTVNWWYDLIEINTAMLMEEEGEEQQIMMAFPKNPQSCTKYRGCPYKDYCDAWPNPLQNCEVIQSPFKWELWDPRNPSGRPTREILELKKGG